MTRVAAIDCGTNSIRLLVADATVGEDGRTRLADLTRQMRIVRLGKGVDARGYRTRARFCGPWKPPSNTSG